MASRHIHPRRIAWTFITLFLCTSVVAARSQAANIAYKELQNARPHSGEEITITGDLKDFTVSDQHLGKVAVVEWENIRKVSVTVTVADAQRSVEAKIDAASWQVSFDQFPKGASLSFDFKLIGGLRPEKTDTVVAALLDDPKYRAALKALGVAAAHAGASGNRVAVGNLLDAAGPVIQKNLPGFLVLLNDKSAADLLKVRVGLARFPDSWDALQPDLERFGETGIAGAMSGASPAEAFQKWQTLTSASQIPDLDGKMDGGERRTLLGQIEAFKTSYQDALGFSKGLVADLPIQVELPLNNAVRVAPSPVINAVLWSVLFSLLAAIIELLSRSKAEPRSCFQAACLPYFLVVALFNTIAAAVATNILEGRLPNVSGLFPMFSAVFGVFAFQVVLSNTNVTLFEKGVLAFQEWTGKARDPAVAAILKRQSEIDDTRKAALAKKVAALPEAQLRAFILNSLGDGAKLIDDSNNYVAKYNADPKLYLALAFVNTAPDAARRAVQTI
jgi:hypothetical protein